MSLVVFTDHSMKIVEIKNTKNLYIILFKIYIIMNPNQESKF